MYLEIRILRYLDILMVALTFAYFSLISTNYFIIVYASIGAVNDYIPLQKRLQSFPSPTLSLQLVYFAKCCAR